MWRARGEVCVVLFSLTGAVTLPRVRAQELPRFEVASVRPFEGAADAPSTAPPTPDGLTYIGFSLDEIVRRAYSVETFRTTGLPAWTREARYTITARAARTLTEPERRLMLRSLLAERFKLKARLENREQTVYALTVARPDGALGPAVTLRPDCMPGSLVPAKPCEATGTGSRLAGYIRGTALTMDNLTRFLRLMIDQVVINETNFERLFDVNVSWRGENAPADDPQPSFFTAVEEQLGLKLRPQRRLVELLIVESIDRATEQ